MEKSFSQKPRPLIKDMDTLPYPAYELLDLDKYSENYQFCLSEELLSTKRKNSHDN